jgi:pyrroline-5-carboxylate reductase
MKLKCLVLGCGKMASAITIAKSQKEKTIEFYCYTPSKTSAKILAEKIHGKVMDDLSSLNSFDLILVACKPQQFAELAEQINHKIASHTIVVSIMAGVRVEQVISSLATPKVVRIMPNTPIAIAKGVNLVYFSQDLSIQDRELVHSFFQDIATSFDVSNQDEFDRLTPIVGSGPALLYYFFNGYIQHLIQNGIEANLAHNIVTSVFAASAHFAHQADRPMEQLISDVTSKAGITFAALNVFEQKDLNKLISQSYQAAYHRNHELNLK